MKKIIIVLAGALLFTSCVVSPERFNKWQEEEQKKKEEKQLQKEYAKFRVDLTAHPDYGFSSTDSSQMKIYDKGLFPLDPEYLVIGKIVVIELSDANAFLVEKNIRVAASYIGGEGVVFTEETMDSYESSGKEKKGMVVPFSNMIFYQEKYSESPKINIRRRSANIIRWKRG